MPAEKRNQFLDAEESEEELEHGYDSDEDLRKGGRDAKRRKVEEEGSDDDDELSGAEVNRRQSRPEHPEEVQRRDREDDNGAIGQTAAAETEAKVHVAKRKAKAEDTEDLPGVSRPLTKKNLVATEKAIKKSGVIYLSRIPPHMKPQKLRTLLEPYGKLNRVFLAPEDPAVYKRRVKMGGNKKKSWSEGWVEFVDKKDAKAACDLLNAQPIGKRGGSYYRDDIWTLKYLKGFKWHDLTEQIRVEAAERAARMRAEISKSTKENKEFVENVERAKVLEGMQSKAAAKLKKRFDETGEAIDIHAQEETTSAVPQKKRIFKQTSLVQKRDTEAPPEQVQRVLSKIF